MDVAACRWCARARAGVSHIRRVCIRVCVCVDEVQLVLVLMLVCVVVCMIITYTSFVMAGPESPLIAPIVIAASIDQQSRSVTCVCGCLCDLPSFPTACGCCCHTLRRWMTRSMGSNKLDGSVPSSLSALKKLETMYAAMSRLNFTIVYPLHRVSVLACAVHAVLDAHMAFFRLCDCCHISCSQKLRCMMRNRQKASSVYSGQA